MDSWIPFPYCFLVTEYSLFLLFGPGEPSLKKYDPISAQQSLSLPLLEAG